MKGSDTTPAAESYLERLSMNCEPFADSIDNRFFYCGTTLMQRLDLLSHLTQFGDSVVLVSGPAGSGKTTLLSRFVSQANNHWHMCLMNADEFDRFPARLADTLVSETRGSEQELFSQWAARTDNAQLLVIIIDRSEHLDEAAVLRLCALLEQPAANRIRLILFGSPEAQQRHKQVIEQKQLDCTTQLLEMPRLSEEETASYLMYRLAVAGYSGESPFTASEIRTICKISDGRPAGINQLAREALLEHPAQAGSNRVRVHQDLHKGGRTWKFATLGALALAAWFGWQNFSLLPTDETSTAPTPLKEQALVIPQPAPLAIPAVTAPPVPITVSPESQAVESQLDAPRPEADPLAAIEPRLNATQTDLAPAGVASEVPSTAGTENTTPAVTPTEHRTVRTVQEPQEPTEDAPNEGIQQRTDSQSPVDIPAPQTAPEPAPVPEPLPHRERWLLGQPGASFSLQLLGSRNAESITGYILQHSLDTGKTAVYKGLYKGAEWYVLLYGSYPSRQAALDGRAALPEAVRSDKPWARSLKSVHSAIREVQ